MATKSRLLNFILRISLWSIGLIIAAPPIIIVYNILKSKTHPSNLLGELVLFSGSFVILSLGVFTMGVVALGVCALSMQLAKKRAQANRHSNIPISTFDVAEALNIVHRADLEKWSDTRLWKEAPSLAIPLPDGTWIIHSDYHEVALHLKAKGVIKNKICGGLIFQFEFSNNSPQEAAISAWTIVEEERHMNPWSSEQAVCQGRLEAWVLAYSQQHRQELAEIVRFKIAMLALGTKNFELIIKNDISIEYLETDNTSNGVGIIPHRYNKGVPRGNPDEGIFPIDDIREVIHGITVHRVV